MWLFPCIFPIPCSQTCTQTGREGLTPKIPLQWFSKVFHEKHCYWCGSVGQLLTLYQSCTDQLDQHTRKRNNFITFGTQQLQVTVHQQKIPGRYETNVLISKKHRFEQDANCRVEAGPESKREDGHNRNSFTLF